MPRVVLHLRTNVAPWTCAASARLDAVLEAAGSTPLDLPWSDFALEDDGDHFTEEGAHAFGAALAVAVHAALGGTPRVLVVADSTMGHRDVPCPKTWEVDAVCGSGFVALAHEGQHFRARVVREASDAVVLVGGWNDVRQTTHSMDRVCAAAEACVARALRK